MTLTELYVAPPEEVTDDDGDVWTKAQDGRYSLGTEIRNTGEFTLGGIQRLYGLFFMSQTE